MHTGRLLLSGWLLRQKQNRFSLLTLFLSHLHSGWLVCSSHDSEDYMTGCCFANHKKQKKALLRQKEWSTLD